MLARFEFRRLFRRIVMLAVHARAVGAKIALEWPARCIYWKIRAVLVFLRIFGLKKVNFDGCAVGLKSIARATKGMPIKKPWSMATDVDEIVSRFEKLTCDGSHVHAPCQGVDTPNSENYTEQHARELHLAHQEYCLNYYHNKVNVDIKQCLLGYSQESPPPVAEEPPVGKEVASQP